MHILPEKMDNLVNWNPFSRNALFYCYPILVLGYLIGRGGVFGSVRLNIVHVVGVIALVTIEAMANYVLVGNEALDILLTLPLASVVIFLYAKGKSAMGSSNLLAKVSVAVFLIHPLWILLYGSFDIGMPKILFAFIMTVISSVILVAISKKIKYIL